MNLLLGLGLGLSVMFLVGFAQVSWCYCYSTGRGWDCQVVDTLVVCCDVIVDAWGGTQVFNMQFLLVLLLRSIESEKD